MITAHRLQITEAEHAALVIVHDMLMAGHIRHHQEAGDERIGNLLHMEISGGSDPQGTKACIGGYVQAIMGGLEFWPGTEIVKLDRDAAEAYLKGGHSPALYTLFHPLRTRHGVPITRCDGEPYDYPWDLIEPREAAAAIHNLLYQGKPNWSDVLFDYLPRADPGIVFPPGSLAEALETMFEPEILLAA